MNLPSNIFRTVVRVVVEIRNASHEEELHEALLEEYPGDMMEWDKGAWGQSQHGSHYNVLKLLKHRVRTTSNCSIGSNDGK
jgi:hypothetical protein